MQINIRTQQSGKFLSSRREYRRFKFRLMKISVCYTLNYELVYLHLIPEIISIPLKSSSDITFQNQNTSTSSLQHFPNWEYHSSTSSGQFSLLCCIAFGNISFEFLDILRYQRHFSVGR